MVFQTRGFGGIDVGEAAENAPPVHGPGRKGVEVQEIIAFMDRKVASLLLFGTKTGVIELAQFRIRHQQVAKETGHFLRITPHDFLQARHFIAVTGRAAQDVLLWPVGNIFVQARFALPLGQKKLPVFLEKTNGTPSK